MAGVVASTLCQNQQRWKHNEMTQLLNELHEIANKKSHALDFDNDKLTGITKLQFCDVLSALR